MPPLGHTTSACLAQGKPAAWQALVIHGCSAVRLRSPQKLWELERKGDIFSKHSAKAQQMENFAY
jgi:hypothetical protein